jgi:CheY-like chemotaxis protein
MEKELDNFDDEDLGEFDKNLLDSDEGVESAPVIRDYSQRQILIWEEDDARREACLEVLTDLLVGATIKPVKTEAEALEQLESEDWDTFVVDFYSEGVSESEFIKRVNNYPGSILVAISMGPLTLPDERDPSKTELLRRLFDMDKPTAQLHG